MEISIAIIETMSIPVPEAGCWLWLSSVDPCGYGQIYTRENPRYTPAHRASYVAHFGAIPEGMCVCHRCDTPRCVNPGHFFLATQLENIRDRHRKGRTRGRQTGPLSPRIPFARESSVGQFSLKFWERHPEIAKQIVADPRSHRATARAFGISDHTVARVRAAFKKQGG